MLTDQCIVCFAPDPWKDLWRNRHRLLSIFARTNRVVYVEPRTRVRKLAAGLKDGSIRPGQILERRVEEVRDNLFVYHDPLFLPRIAWRGVGPAVDSLRFAMLRRTLRKLGCSRPILWLVRPDCWDIPGRLGEKLVLYQVVDDYLTYSGLTDRATERIDGEERRLASLADLVVVTSDHLLETKSHLHEHMVLVPNGVDARTLEEGSRAAGPLPPELENLPRPLLGYLGGVTEKLDLELLEKVAADLGDPPRGTLAFVGSINVHSGEARERIRRLESSPAVVFTGRKDAADVPMYLRAFDVCLVPYRPGRQARAIDPLKLYEYLAFGKPVVTADIPSVQRFASVVTIAGTQDAFLRGIQDAVRNASPELAARRRAAAAENSWEERAARISRALKEALKRRPAARAQ